MEETNPLLEPLYSEDVTDKDDHILTADYLYNKVSLCVVVCVSWCVICVYMLNGYVCVCMCVQVVVLFYNDTFKWVSGTVASYLLDPLADMDTRQYIWRLDNLLGVPTMGNALVGKLSIETQKFVCLAKMKWALATDAQKLATFGIEAEFMNRNKFIMRPLGVALSQVDIGSGQSFELLSQVDIASGQSFELLAQEEQEVQDSFEGAQVQLDIASGQSFELSALEEQEVPDSFEGGWVDGEETEGHDEETDH
jgi:hypothetical protein